MEFSKKFYPHVKKQPEFEIIDAQKESKNDE